MQWERRSKAFEEMWAADLQEASSLPFPCVWTPPRCSLSLVFPSPAVTSGTWPIFEMGMGNVSVWHVHPCASLSPDST